MTTTDTIRDLLTTKRLLIYRSTKGVTLFAMPTPASDRVIVTRTKPGKQCSRLAETETERLLSALGDGLNDGEIVGLLSKLLS